MDIARPEKAALRVRGFTMIELMTTIAVLAVLIAIAVPSFAATINKNRLATAANELVTSLQLARMEAVRRGVPVTVCATANANTANPSCATGSWGQWITFIDSNGDRDRDAGESVLRASVVNGNVVMVAGPAVASAAGSDQIIFRPDGLAYASSGALLTTLVNTCIKTTHPLENGRNVRIRSGSSVIVETAAADAECTAPESD